MKRWYSNLSLLWKLNSANSLIIFATVFIVAFLSNSVSSRMISLKAAAGAEQNLKTVEHNLNRLFSHAEDLAKVAIVSDSVQSLLRMQYRLSPNELFKGEFSVRSFLDSVIEPRKVVSSMVLFGTEDILAASSYVGVSDAHRQQIRSGAGDAAGVSWVDRMIWIDFRNLGYEIESPGYCVSLLRPIFNVADYSLLGMLQTNVGELSVRDAYASFLDGSGGDIFLVSSKGEIVSSSKSADVGRSVHGAPYAEILKRSGTESAIYTIGSKRFLVSVHSYPKLGWRIVSTIPMKSLLADTNSVTAMIALAGFILAFLAFLVSIAVSRSITRPIISLTRLMAAAGQGDLEVRSEVSGGDEVAILSANFNAMIHEISQLLERVEKEQRQKRNYELAALQAQINPHFLYNTLESVCSLAQLGRNDDVFAMVKSLARFYRSALSKGRSVIPVSEELALVREYLFIQKVRYADKLDFCFDIQEEILGCSILKLSIQPLVENAIYHGIKAMPGGGTVRIRGLFEPGLVRIQVIDNGPGIDPEAAAAALSSHAAEESPEDRRSFGLAGLNERLKLYFGDGYGLDLRVLPEGGTLAEIRIPAQETE